MDDDDDEKLENYLLSLKNTDVNVADKSGKTALHYACSVINSNSLELIKRLLRRNADINAVSEFGVTPFVTFLTANKYDYTDMYHPGVMNLFFKYADLSIGLSLINVHTDFPHVESYRKKAENFSKCVSKYLAMYSELNSQLYSTMKDSLARNGLFHRKHFNRCKEELKRAKSIQLNKCWITYFDLLVQSNKKIKNFVNNKDVLDDLKSRDLEELFPNYKNFILEKIEKGQKKRRSYDNSRSLLPESVPVFNPGHLVVRDVLDCLSSKDLEQFCKVVTD